MIVFRSSMLKGMLVFFCIVSAFQVAAQKKLSRAEKDMAAYLMVYFKDETHSLHFALSKDGYSFTDVNNGNPVMAGDTIAEQKGIRDPYIYRGPDGLFYMALTDLHIFAKKAGLRDTEWERDDKKFGWGNNRGIVLLKSKDLVNWSHTVLRVDRAYPELDNIGCAWAPELIWDKKLNKMMMYFTIRFGNGANKLYYAYMNKDFTGLDTRPELLFKYPGNQSYIDGDITPVGEKYHLMYVVWDKGSSGVKQAVSNSLTHGYQYDSTYVDPEPGACEAPTVFKRIGEQKWVLMYDVFSVKPNNMGFSETTDFVHFQDLGHFNKGVMKTTNFSSPKHGAVIHLTRKEAEQLARHWNTNISFK